MIRYSCMKGGNVANKVQSFDEMSTEALICRASNRHAMRLTMTEVVFVSRKKGLKYHFGPCLNCGTTRTQVVLANHRSRSVDSVGGGYDHPDNYLIKNRKKWGPRKTFNDNVKYELFLRMMAQAEKKGKTKTKKG